MRLYYASTFDSSRRSACPVEYSPVISLDPVHEPVTVFDGYFEGRFHCKRYFA